jgi:hypothetical protein
MQTSAPEKFFDKALQDLSKNWMTDFIDFLRKVKLPPFQHQLQIGLVKNGMHLMQGPGPWVIDAIEEFSLPRGQIVFYDQTAAWAKSGLKVYSTFKNY